MKKILYISILITLAFGVFACSDDNQNNEATLELLESNLYFSASGGEGFVELKSSDPISFEKDRDWFTASLDGTKITIIVSEYFSPESRTGTIKVTSGDQTKYIIVYQSGPSLYIDHETRTFDYKLNVDTTYSVKISNTYPDKIDIVALLKNENDKKWAEPIIRNDSLVVNLKKNTEVSAKSLSIYIGIKDGDNPVVIKDSINLVTLLKKENIFGKWEATFSNGSKTLTQEIDIARDIITDEMYIDGFMLYEGGNTPVRLPITTSSPGLSSDIVSGINIKMGAFLGMDSNLFVFINPRTSGSSFTYWRPGVGPEAYPGYVGIDDNSKLFINFPDYNYSGNIIGGFTFRGFPSNKPANGTGSKSSRSILGLKLTQIK